MVLVNDAVEAFLELGCENGTPLDPLWYSAGYRLIRTGEIVCSVKLPWSVAEAAILGRSKVSVSLSPSGQIEVSAGGVLVNEQIDRLVARAVSEENLDLEEATALDLRSLLHCLEHSMDLVKGAIERMPTAPAAAID
ncbi:MULTISPECIES: hypothetical protein [unclassified Bradyrhizobium]|uniref:hypothetical protein n=1 Tax=unclassified Bradyrhizobium TaxID=2631580 RepID=UPI0020B2BD92|nr:MULTISPECIES: hypothetical protein [unclassified Bradyrhizobium]MCP3402159.1 hypothetical protein [Bradyrhizobium sp. CCGB20]MCP3410648.1 hypothetical protein [Bradyrhizobium sp. CCGB01]